MKQGGGGRKKQTNKKELRNKQISGKKNGKAEDRFGMNERGQTAA